MSVETTHPELEIDCSVGNLLDKSTLYTAFWTTAQIVDAIKEAGYRGLEWHPLRGTVAGIEMQAGLVIKDVKDAIISLHQSYRNEKSWKEAWNHKNRFLALQSYILLPERVSSLNDLEHLQKVVGHDLPIVLFPSKPEEESGTNRQFAEKLFQPTPEVMTTWKVKNPEELITEAYKKGYTGLCIPLFHMRGKAIDGISLGPWQETLPQLLPHAKEIHVEVGRADIIQNQIDTEGELVDLLSGKAKSELAEMLKTIRRSKWRGRIVTETPAMALHNLRTSKSMFLSPKDLIEEHKRLIGNIQDILA